MRLNVNTYDIERVDTPVKTGLTSTSVLFFYKCTKIVLEHTSARQMIITRALREDMLRPLYLIKMDCHMKWILFASRIFNIFPYNFATKSFVNGSRNL